MYFKIKILILTSSYVFFSLSSLSHQKSQLDLETESTTNFFMGRGGMGGPGMMGGFGRGGMGGPGMMGGFGRGSMGGPGVMGGFGRGGMSGPGMMGGFRGPGMGYGGGIPGMGYESPGISYGQGTFMGQQPYLQQQYGSTSYPVMQTEPTQPSQEQPAPVAPRTTPESVPNMQTPEDSSKMKPLTPKTRTELISTFNQALKNPEFNEDFKRLIKTQMGKWILDISLSSEENSQYIIKILKSGKFQDVTSRITPVRGPLGDIMQMMEKDKSPPVF